MIRIFFILFVALRYLPEYFNSNNLYWLINSILMLSICFYIFYKSDRNIINLFLGFGLTNLLGYDFINNVNLIINGNDFKLFTEFTLIPLSLLTYLLIFRNRYNWAKQKSHKYDENKLQAIYSKPNTFLMIFGAAISFSPKCSVRYTYKGQTIRFKKGYDTPIKCKTVIKKTDIIKDTKIDPNYFNIRYNIIKDMKYNILFFNCKSLF